MKSFIYVCFLVIFSGFAPAETNGCPDQALSLAQGQLTDTIAYIGTSQYPQATDPNHSNRWNATAASDWTSGFFPGLTWYMYEQTLDPAWLSRAKAQTASLSGETTDASSHDIGFRILGGYGNGYRITRDPAYMSAIQTAAKTMSTLFRPGAGVIESWPYYDSNITVIIDNMMNLELLFYAAQNGGDPTWYDMAVSHALKTIQNNVRTDGSTYQVVDYNTDGTVNSKFTVNGAATESTWSRGQAWGLYGFTMSYRYTQDPRFLATAQQLANYFIGHLPPDYVPYWDFSKSSPAPRDSSAAAIAAAGLLELSTFVAEPDKSTYYNAALNIQNSLTSVAYLGDRLATDGILLHGTAEVPLNLEVDTSLIYGDYYFVQGCYRGRTPPPAPIGLSAVPYSTQVSLAWNAQSGAVRYSVKRSVSPGGPYITIAPSPVLTTNSYVDSAVASSTTYYYVVSAITAAGESPNSAEVIAVTSGQKTASTTTLVSSLNPSIAGRSVTFTATISPSAATGTVLFSVDGTAAGSPVTVAAGSAAFSTSAVSVGTHNVSAVYGGDTNYNVSASNVVVQAVQKAPSPDFSISVSPGSVTAKRGSNAVYTVTIARSNGFSGNITLSASGLPPHAGGSFSPSPISGSSTGSVLTISTTGKTTMGTRILTITGTNGNLTHNVKVSLTIN